MPCLEEIILPKPPQPKNTIQALKNADYEDIIQLPEWQMKRLTKLLSKAIREKYKKKQKQYTGIIRIPTRKQVQTIIANTHSEKVKLIWKIMSQRGLRPSEVVKLKAEDVKAVEMEGIQKNVPFLTVNNTKSGRIENRVISRQLYAEIMAYIERHRIRIQTHEGYLFYAVNPLNKQGHISVDYLHNSFRRICKRLGYNSSYARVKNTQAKSGYGTRYNLTPYSLRHYAITEFWRKTHDLKKTQMFASHRDPKTTMNIYVETSRVELARTILEKNGQQTLFNV